MIMQVEHLTKSFGGRTLFSDACFRLEAHDRLALVGPNGAGKTTMLKVITGHEDADSGNVVFAKGAVVGYLEQEAIEMEDRSIFDEVISSQQEILEAEQRLHELEASLNENSTPEKLAACGRARERYEALGGYRLESQVRSVLFGLGFKEDDMSRHTGDFSGGWQMRIALAKLLIRKPDLLLLDEPTNHLDLESVKWLEGFLRGYDGAVVVVSHDRAFMDNMVDRVAEIDAGRLELYKGNYSAYLKQRDERIERLRQQAERQAEEIAHMEAFIEKFRYKPTKAVQVQNRIKQLAKIVPIEVDEVDNSALHLKFPPCSRSGDYPVICEELTKFYGDHCVLRNVNLTIKRGEKVAFVGRNGEGKSTWVKCLMGETDFKGTLKLGHGVEIGYYAQNQAQLLDGELTVFDTIDRVATGDIRTKIRDILGAFMFGGEASDKKVKVLSGGERSRLAMIRLLLEPVNFLILDEPTNHLDMRTKDVLKEALTAFDGTVIVVSHDRDFLKGLVSRVYEFGGGNIREHIGGIEDFLQDKEREENATRNETLAAPKPTEEKNTEVSEGKRSYEERKEFARLKRKAEKEVAQLEEKVTGLETEKAEIEEKLATPEGAADTDLYTRYTALQQEIRETEERWEQALTDLEENFSD